MSLSFLFFSQARILSLTVKKNKVQASLLKDVQHMPPSFQPRLKMMINREPAVNLLLSWYSDGNLRGQFLAINFSGHWDIKVTFIEQPVKSDF